MSRQQRSRKVVFVALALVVLGAGAIGLYRVRHSGGSEDATRPVMATIPGLGRFVIHDPRDLVQARLLKGEPFEPQLIPVFTQYVTAGMHVADFGAFNGVHTIRMANLVGPGGRVHAFEPNPPAFAMLQENIRLNGLEDRIIAQPYALGDQATTGRVAPARSERNLAGSAVCTDEDIRTNARGCGSRLADPITTVRIDDDVARWFPQRVGFVLIDVEGYEDRVLAGSRAWLMRDHPVILIELWDDEKRKKEGVPLPRAALIAMLEGLGYRQAQHFPAWNYVFVPTP